jgi:acetolactate synthase-1/2/3 large subunit
MDEALTTSAALVKGFEEAGIKDAFLVTGGAIAGFTEALSKSKVIQCHYLLTEQSAAIAAESYGHFDGSPALLVVTSGPGATNAITGVAAGWTNSTPMIVISGQARSADIKLSKQNLNRQWGNQHLNTIDIVKSITKYQFEPTESFDAKNFTFQFVQCATTGRKGPVWLSLPSDIQRMPIKVEDKTQLSFSKPLEKLQDVQDIFALVKSHLDRSIRPALLIGNGARNMTIDSESIARWAELNSVALLTTWTGLDLITSDAPTYFGRPGTIASSRVANSTAQACDFLLVLGARLDLAQIGFRPNDFASQANVLRIDLDDSEFLRIPPRKNWTNIKGDAALILKLLCENENHVELPERIDWIRDLKIQSKLPTGRERREFADGISTYSVVDELVTKSFKNVVLGSSGTCVEMVLQSWQVSHKQRFMNSGGLGSMGFALSGGIGVAVKTGQEVLVIESDGSLSMNIQDLETIARSNLPLKIVVLDSNGYKSIALSQRRQGQAEHGNSVATGVFLPDSIAWSSAAGIQHNDVKNLQELQNAIEWLVGLRGPGLIRIKVSETEEALPRLLSKPNAMGFMETTPFTELWPEIEK